ncbi:ABC transporter substrate-binding protein [Amaricoccus macauensis]|uniref:ABC transporter substrate-binding protein n=1 Tax=Amaricoccus macauensis TaxID=57001 RepID=UPI003C7D3930
MTGRLRPLLLAGLFAAAPTAPVVHADDAPARVVSMNLCTDQLAMMLARPGQLVAVSDIAQDPVSSAMAEEAGAYPFHHNSAEEIYLLEPDLVLAGTYSPPETVALLRRLGIRVEAFPIGASFEDIRSAVRRMGDLLGTPDRAEVLITRMDAALEAPTPETRPRAAVYYSNGYTSGAGSLANAVIDAAGMDNIAVEDGRKGLSRLPLETLILSDPDLLITGQEYSSPARAQEILRHPALGAVTRARESVAGRLWVCATPRAAEAVTQLRQHLQP